MNEVTKMTIENLKKIAQWVTDTKSITILDDWTAECDIAITRLNRGDTWHFVVDVNENVANIVFNNYWTHKHKEYDLYRLDAKKFAGSVYDDPDFLYVARKLLSRWPEIKGKIRAENDYAENVYKSTVATMKKFAV